MKLIHEFEQPTTERRGSAAYPQIATVPTACRRRKEWAIFARHDARPSTVGLPSKAERPRHLRKSGSLSPR